MRTAAAVSSRRLLCLASVAGVAVLATAEAQQQAPKFTARVDGVRLHVAVNAGNRSVTGLSGDAFVVTDNGVRQEISTASNVDRLAVGFVLDHSETVAVAPLNEMRAAALTVLDMLAVDDTAGVLTFTDRLNKRIAATRDRTRVRQLIASTLSEPRTGTALWDAMLAGASMVARQPGRPVIVVVSDGCDNASWTSPQRATEWLSRSDVTVDILWFGTRRRVREPRLNFSGADICYGRLDWDKTAAATGGRMFRTDQGDITKALTQRVNELRSGYFLTYTPTGVRKDDGWHQVEVRLQGGAKGRVTARPGYFAGGSSK